MAWIAEPGSTRQVKQSRVDMMSYPSFSGYQLAPASDRNDLGVVGNATFGLQRDSARHSGTFKIGNIYVEDFLPMPQVSSAFSRYEPWMLIVSIIRVRGLWSRWSGAVRFPSEKKLTQIGEHSNDEKTRRAMPGFRNPEERSK